MKKTFPRLLALLIGFIISSHAAFAAEKVLMRADLCKDPTAKGGWSGAVAVSDDQKMIIAGRLTDYVRSYIGDADADVQGQVYDQLVNQSAESLIVPKGTKSKVMGSRKKLVYRDFILGQDIPGHVFTINLGSAGTGKLTVFDDCLNGYTFSIEKPQLPPPPPVVVVPPTKEKGSLIIIPMVSGSTEHMNNRGALNIGYQTPNKRWDITAGGGYTGSFH
ncbi:MAG: hypothetical protein HGA67_00745 [Candidatus Yonathbacteria bacterium]|nr:hypothetical protein [Candidatus Yonathbacteria bacterium]